MTRSAIGGSSRGLDARLASALARLAEGAHAERLAVEQAELLALGVEVLRRDLGRAARAEELGSELQAVQRAEQAELLRQAIELLLSGSVEGRLLGGARAEAHDEGRWRRRCAEEIACALAGGTRVVGELLVCALQERRAWPEAAELAAPLLGLRSTAATRACAARALFAAGRRAPARRLLAHLELAELGSRARAALLDAQACDVEHQGRERQALKLFERAASCGAGTSAEVSALLLALRTDRSESVDRCLERLRCARPTAARLQRALRELEEKRCLLGRGLSCAERRRVERLVFEVGRST